MSVIIASSGRDHAFAFQFLLVGPELVGFRVKPYPRLAFQSLRRGFSGHTGDEWRRIVEAVEATVPLYESVSEAISFGLAGPLRRRAIEWLSPLKQRWVLDLGTGPGVSLRILLARGFDKVVGLDPSARLLRYTKASVKAGFDPVVGVSENLPFRGESLGTVLACFSMRDVKDPLLTIQEVFRVTGKDGRFAIVDVGKADSPIKRGFAWVYLRFAMPIIARALVGGRLHGNPFWMIIPTFQRLLSNRQVALLVERAFGPAKMKEYILGGLVVIRARRTST